MMAKTPALPIAMADVERAAERLKGGVKRTPSDRSETLSAILGAHIHLKFEIFQFTGSFKDRGALNRLLCLTPEERGRGVVAASAGNHAQAVAYHCGRLGVPALIVMPRDTPFLKVTRTEAFGAEVVLQGESFAEAQDVAEKLGAKRGYVFVHPFDDPAVMAGQGTVALEFLADAPMLDCLVVPVGGGGLIAGCAVAAKALKPGVEVIGVQAAAFPGMAAALKGAEAAGGARTIAEGIAVKAPGRLTRRVAEALVDDILLVSEDDIERAICLLAEIEKVVAEGAGAAALAALLSQRERFRGRHVGLVLSGANIDSRALAGCLMRGLFRDGRIVRLSVEAEDAPGALGRIAKVIGDAGGNIVEVTHQRMLPEMSLRYTEVSFIVETRDRRHAESIAAALDEAGFAVRLGA